MTDQLNGAVEAANEPALSLRDELAAEFEKMSAEPSAPVEAAAPVAPQETAEEAEARARDEKGRFAPKQAQESEATQAAAKTAQTPEASQETPEGQEAPRYAGPPPGWSVAAKAAFDELPDAVKQAIAKREQEIDNGFSKLKDYKEIDRSLEPYRQTARQYGVDVPKLLERFDAADKFLQRDPINAMKWLCETYKVDPRQLVGQQPAPQAAQVQPQPGTVDPSIQPLLQEINSLKQRLGRVDEIEQTIYQDKFNTVASQVERFGADPKNRYFEDVADQMVTLISQANASGQPVDLASIYETACYMNPEVRQALISEQRTAEQKAVAEKAKQAANQARQAGASITGGTSTTPATAEPDSANLRALLEQGYAAQMGRT